METIIIAIMFDQMAVFEFNLPQGNYYAKVYAETAGNQNKRTSPKLLTVGSSISTLSFTLRDVVANPQVKSDRQRYKW